MSTQLNLQSIIIKKVIVHTIPKHLKAKASTDEETTILEPKYSKQESKLSDGLKLFLKDKIVQALGSDKSIKVKFDDSNLSPVSFLIKEIFGNSDNFIEHSKNFARHLFNVQVGSNTAGILVCIFGAINSKDTCFLLKLEMDKGMQLKLDPETESYDIAEVEDLMLTQKTKIYKVAMLISRDDFSADYDGQTMDYQIDLKNKKDVTTWFIERFLGCTAYEDPKVTTQKFYNLTRAFIDTIDEPIEKAKYVQDLNSYVQKNSLTLSPKEFSEDYLETTEHRAKYKSFMESKNFNFSSFYKDISQISRQIQKIMITFENDISIVGSKGTFDDKVKLEKLENGQTRAEITSRIRKIA